MLITGGWAEVVNYFRALPPISVAFLLVALLPAALLYWLPNWLEKKIRRQLELYSRKIQQAIRKRGPGRRDDSAPRIEK